MDDRVGARLNWWRLLGWMVTLLALGFIVKWLIGIDRSVWSSIIHLRLGWLIASLAMFQIWFLLRYLAWEVIVRRHGSDAQRHQTLRTWTISELMRYVPGNVWSFAAKYRGTVTTGATGAHTVQALAIEAAGQFSGSVVVGLLLLNPVRWWWFVLLYVAFVPMITPLLLELIGRVAHWKNAPRVTMPEALGLLLWYALVWIIFGLATAMVYWSFHNVPGLTLTKLIGVNVVAWFIGYASVVTPMGLGVREVTFVKLLAGTVSTSLASLIALVTRLWFVLSELIFLMFVLSWSWIRRS